MLEDKENVSKDRVTTSKDKETTSKDRQITRKEETDNEQKKPAKTSESESVDDLTLTTDNAVRTIDIVVNDPSVLGDNSQVEHDSDQNIPNKYDDEGEVGERESSETDNESETVESSRLGGVRKAERMFRTLSFETDINVAPVNWLRGENGQMGKCRLDSSSVLLTNI